jgi:gliding motility-associated-like protein
VIAGFSIDRSNAPGISSRAYSRGDRQPPTFIGLLMRALLATLFLFTIVGVTAQDHWARRLGAWSNDAFNDVVNAPDGSFYAAGEFGGNFEISGQTLISQGSLDAVVAKYDGNGLLLWTRTFGGSGMDRAIKLALTADGGIAVVGQFMGSAVFDGTTLISQGGTQDCFVLKMAQLDGAVQWVRQGGSADGVDQPNGVSVGPDGSIAVAGEFRGNAVFDQGNLISITDPDTNEPSVDIFLATYTSTGAPLWIQQGAAEFADRGMDVVHDSDGNLYLTGQFSDTLTFDATHDNAMFSSVFIAQFNAVGEEQWFRAFGGGTYNQVFEIIVVQDSYLMLVGDVQGTVIFVDTEPDLFTAAEPRSSFLLKVGLDGELIAQTTWGSEHPVSTRSLSIQNDDVAVLGKFRCQLTGFTVEYGESSFLATGPWDLYVARFQLSDLLFKQAQQFGGQGDKQPGGIAHTLDDDVVFTGSFEWVLIFPTDGAFSATPAVGVVSPQVPIPYCNDDDYGTYSGLHGSALKDGFIARGFFGSREPYDVFRRQAGPCMRDFAHPVIVNNSYGEVGPDSIRYCTQAGLYVYTHTAFTADTSIRHTAPQFDILWNTGQTNAGITVIQSGWYSVEVSIGDGCWSRVDSIHVTIDSIPPPPLINDDVVVNTDAAIPLAILVCEPAQPLLWATGVDPADSVFWTGPPLVGQVLNDTIQATMAGGYTATVISAAGCVNSNAVNVVIFPDEPLPPLEAELEIIYEDDLDLNDTLYICQGDAVGLTVDVDLTLFGDSVGLPYGIVAFHRCIPTGAWLQNAPFQVDFACTLFPVQEGWYTSHVGLALTNAPCGTDTLYFEQTDSIYVVPYPVASVTVTIDGPSVICPGDTATLLGSCTGCDVTGWSGPGIVAGTHTTAQVVQPGTYYFSGSLTDINGCGAYAAAGLVITWNPNPSLYADPVDGIICPNDSATIFTNAVGTDLQWFGPLGPLSVDNDTIYTSQQGFYYLEMVDSLGCPVSSDPILITDYATPFLNVLPDNVLCEPGETAVLYVVTTSTSTLLWEAPFAGSNAMQQTVSQPGIYTCSVNACGITTVLSTEIFGNTSNAELVVPGPFDLCPGGEVTLEALPGQSIYYWEPGPIFSTGITTDTAGIFLLVVSDANGCKDSLYTEVNIIPTDSFDLGNDTLICPGGAVVLNAPIGFTDPVWSTGSTEPQVLITSGGSVWLMANASNGCTISDTVLVSVFAFSQPLVAEDVIACLGDSITLGANGSGTIAWYADDALTDLVATGNTLFLVQPPVGITPFYITQSEGPCTSVSAELELIVKPRPANVTLVGPTVACPGESIAFFMGGTTITEATWTTPQGPITGTSVVINDVQESDQGTYTVVPYYGICSGEPLSISLDVFDPQVPDLGPDTTFCEGASFTLSIPEGYANPTWSTGVSGFSTVVFNAGMVSVFAFDPQGCPVSDSMLVAAVPCDAVIPNVVTPNGDGVNDGWILGPGPYITAMLEVYNRWGQRVWRGDVIHQGFEGTHEDNGEPLSEATYFYILYLTKASGAAQEMTGYFTLLR